MNKFKWQDLALTVAIVLLLGGLGAMLGENYDFYDTLNKPFFAPPQLLFPIAWGILYVLMGIATYLIEIQEKSVLKRDALRVFWTQLIVNILWPFFFFNLQWITFAFWWLIVLILLVIATVYFYYKLKPLASYLLIPYLAWIIFAAILNYTIDKIN